jgi:hypothetical protein
MFSTCGSWRVGVLVFSGLVICSGCIAYSPFAFFGGSCVNVAR